MHVTLELSPEFSAYAENQRFIEVEGRTPMECMERLISRFPIFKSLLFDAEHRLMALVICQGEVIIQSRLNLPLTCQHNILLRPMFYGG